MYSNFCSAVTLYWENGDWEFTFDVWWYVLGKPLWRLIIEQFDDLLVKILLLAAIISFVSDVFLYWVQTVRLIS